MGDLRRFEETADDSGSFDPEAWGSIPDKYMTPYSTEQIDRAHAASEAMVNLLVALNAAVAAGVRIEADLSSIEHTTMGAAHPDIRWTGSLRAYAPIKL